MREYAYKVSSPGSKVRYFYDQETMIDSLLEPQPSYDGGELEWIREQISHMRGCLARFMCAQGLTMEELNEIFYYGEIAETEEGDP